MPSLAPWMLFKGNCVNTSNWSTDLLTIWHDLAVCGYMFWNLNLIWLMLFWEFVMNNKECKKKKKATCGWSSSLNKAAVLLDESTQDAIKKEVLAQLEKSVCMGTMLWSKAAYWESPVLASLSCCAAWDSWKAASGWAESGSRVHSRSNRSATPFRSSQNPNASAAFLRRFSS